LGKAHDIRTNIPQRLDRLPWSRWHWLVVVALGITWVLDGLEVTVVGSIGPRLEERAGLGLSATQVGEAATGYLLGAVTGAIVFGNLTDRAGRKRLFLVTLLWYLTFTLLSAASWSFAAFFAFRLLAGMGIGGEYAAINSAIDELIPSWSRGWVDLSINGTWWLGTIFGSLASLVLLDTHLVNAHIGWRLTFLLGAVLAFAILFVRRRLPESPRWLMLHGREREAEGVVRDIETEVSRTSESILSPPSGSVTFTPREATSVRAIAQAMIRRYPKRTAVSLCLMISQAFLYNAVFFTEALVLTSFFHVPSARVGLYIFPLAVGNLAGPIALGHFFDSVGRRMMIGTTYALSGVLLVVTGLLFAHGMLDAVTLTAAWSVIFFVASAGASSAYLTVSEIFPLDIRAMAIAIVYAAGTLAGGALAPTLFGALIATKSPAAVTHGYLVGAAAMIAAALAEWVFGVEASRKLLEDIAPL
jgi:MFS family permease